MPIVPYDDKAVPLPSLNWTINTELWKLMHKKEVNVYTRDCTYLKKHIGITAQMRAILLDWIVEVGFLSILTLLMCLFLFSSCLFTPIFYQLYTCT